MIYAPKHLIHDVWRAVRALPEVDPTKHPATHNYAFEDIRNIVPRDAGEWTLFFDQQHDFYSSRVQFSMEELPHDLNLMTEVPAFEDRDGVVTTLTFQQLWSVEPCSCEG